MFIEPDHIEPPSRPILHSEHECTPFDHLHLNAAQSSSGDREKSVPTSTEHLDPAAAPTDDLSCSPPAPHCSDLSLAQFSIPEAALCVYAPLFSRTGEWGTPWEHCAAAFLDLEQAAGFEMKSYQLPKSTKRPAALAQWIQSKRVTSGPVWDGLSVGDVSEFAGIWWEWWRAIQPAGRTTSESGSLSRVDGLDWKRLHKSGPNGLLLVLVVLVFWRNMARGDKVAAGKWGEAVEDVTWAMLQMKGVSGLPVKNARKRKYVDVKSLFFPLC